jgi:hypothetical protein
MTALIKARSKPLDARSTAHHPAIAAAMDELEKTVGGRTALIRLLAAAPLEEDLAHVLNVIADPKQDLRRLSTVCKQAGISLGEMYQVLKQGLYVKAVVQVMQTVATQTPPVVEDIFKRAVPHDITCPECRGVTTVTNASKPDAGPTICTACNGTGKQEMLPDVERQKLALSIGPFAPKALAQNNGTIDNRTQILNHSVTPQGFADLLAETDALLHPRRRGVPALEVDIVDAEAQAPAEGGVS